MTAHEPSPPRSLPPGIHALVTAVAVSSLGDGVFLAAAPLAAAAITHDPVAVSLVAAAELAPWLLMMPFAGALVDRWKRDRLVLVTTDLIRTGVLAVLTILMAIDRASIAAIAICAALIMAAMTLHDTASQTITADLTDRNGTALAITNGRINAATTGAKALIGPPVGAALFVVASWAPFAIDAMSFAISAALLATLPRTSRAAEEPDRSPLLKSIALGTKWLARHRTLRAMCLVIAIGNLCYQAALATLVLYAQDELKLTEFGFGVLLAVGAIGGIMGGLTASRVISRLGDRWTLVLGLSAQAAGFAMLASTRSAAVAGAALALAILGTAWSSVVVISARQRLTPSALLGRVTAAFRTIGTGAMPLGAALGGVIASAYGLRTPQWAAAITLGVVVIAAAAMSYRSTYDNNPAGVSSTTDHR